MNPIHSTSLRSGLPCRFPAVHAAGSTRACPRLLALAALCLFALPGVSRAESTLSGWEFSGILTWTSTSWYQTTEPAGPQDTGGDGSLQFNGGAMKIGAFASGTLNQTGGTINISGVSWQTIIAHAGGVEQTDFSAFQVVGNTLSLATGSSGNYASWAIANGFDPAHPEYVGTDGLTNLLVYALDLKTDGTNGSPGTLTGNLLSFTKRAEAVTNGDVTYAIEASPDSSPTCGTLPRTMASWRTPPNPTPSPSTCLPWAAAATSPASRWRRSEDLGYKLYIRCY